MRGDNEMTRVDLITGFLGAGKTTFIQRYIHFLESVGQADIQIIENEYGMANVDTRLLNGYADSIRSLAGMCMCCSGMDKFKTYLMEAAQKGCDRILVEPSGIYDVDEFFSVMSDPTVSKYCETGSIIMIADADWDESLSTETRYLMCTQLLAAGAVVLSKTQEHTEEEADHVEEALRQLVRDSGAPEESMPAVFRKAWTEMTDDDFRRLMNAGWKHVKHTQIFMDHQDVYSSAVITGKCRDRGSLERTIEEMFAGRICGDVIRVKGFVEDLDGNWFTVNCTRQDRVIMPSELDLNRGMLAVIGQSLEEEALRSVLIPRR